jgi:hypothetical protein
MIFFLRTSRNRHPLDRYLASWGRRFRSVVQPIDYDHLLARRRFLPGVYVFADLEFLDTARRHRAAEVWDELRAMGPAVRLLNDPRRSLLRYDLLRRLHQEGFNDFTVYRHDEDMGAVRFPAFVRAEDDHEGSRTQLVSDQGELADVLAELRRARPDQSWLITEFCDTVGNDGLYSKYAAFHLDGEVIPRHVFFSRGWCLKNQDLVEADLMQTELDYMQANPHQEQIRELFNLARLDYGRIDYGVRNGRIQVWEINTNPMILSFESYAQLDRLQVHKRFDTGFARALHGLAGSRPGSLRQNYPGQRLRASIRCLFEQPRIRPVVHQIRDARYRITALVPRPVKKSPGQIPPGANG